MGQKVSKKSNMPAPKVANEIGELIGEWMQGQGNRWLASSTDSPSIRSAVPMFRLGTQ